MATETSVRACLRGAGCQGRKRPQLAVSLHSDGRLFHRGSHAATGRCVLFWGAAFEDLPTKQKKRRVHTHPWQRATEVFGLEESTRGSFVTELMCKSNARDTDVHQMNIRGRKGGTLFTVCYEKSLVYTVTIRPLFAPHFTTAVESSVHRRSCSDRRRIREPSTRSHTRVGGCGAKKKLPPVPGRGG